MLGGDFMAGEYHKKLLWYLLYGGLLFAVLYLFFRYLFFACLPFLLSFAAATFLHRPTVKISRKTKISYRAVSVFLAVFFVTVFLGAVGLLLWTTVSEVGKFIRSVVSGENKILEEIGAVLRKGEELISRLPFFSNENASLLQEKTADAVLDMVKNTLVSAAAKLPELAGRVAAAVPQVFIFFIVTVLSAVYFCIDYEKILTSFKARLSVKRFGVIRRLYTETVSTVVRFIKSYCVLFLFTFAELFLGFGILGEPYAFLLALVTSAVDSLPIFGTGTVLLPLAVYRLITGDIGYAVGVAVLYIVITILRQILEPRILGAGMGVHPLLMLMAMYVGLRLFGVLGMLLFPFLTVIAKNMVLTIKNVKGEMHIDEKAS